MSGEVGAPESAPATGVCLDQAPCETAGDVAPLGRSANRCATRASSSGSGHTLRRVSQGQPEAASTS